MTDDEQILFWVLTMISLLLFFFIMMNYIIADASSVYTKVSLSLDNFMFKEKAQMVAESERTIPKKMLTQDTYPKYIITRSVEK